VPADVVVVTDNVESWISAEKMLTWLRVAGHADMRLLMFGSKCYVGAQIGIHNQPV
jgi:3-mercaptopyruvate sulfurtransferase SseA